MWIPYLQCLVVRVEYKGMKLSRCTFFNDILKSNLEAGAQGNLLCTPVLLKVCSI